MSAPSQQLFSPTSVKNQRSPGSRESDEQDNWSGEESNNGGEAQGENKKRKRPMSVSCEMCKQRKVKCDRGQPNCGWCVRNNQLCEYKERKKPGLRAGYGRELEARLDRLEEILYQQQNAIAQLTRDSQSVQAASHHDDSIFRSPPAIQTPQVTRPETALFLQRSSTFPPQTPLISDYGGGLGGRHTSGMSNGTGFQQSMSAGGMQQHTLPGLPMSGQDMYSQPNPALESPSLNLPGAPAPTVSTDDHDFPPYDLLYALADLFFKHINTWCPILHRRTTLDSLFGPSTLDQDDRILLHAIVATTLRFSTDARLTKESREKYHATSKQKVLLYGLENSSVKALQAMVILALDLVGASNGPPGWNLLALITRSVVQLGLAVETTSLSVAPNYPSIYTLRAMILPEPKDWIEEESRRRLFWMVYLLDRYATIATAFEFALDEKEIDRRLPCRDDLFSRNQAVQTRWFRTSQRHDYSMNKPENLGSFSYYIEVIGILSRIHQFLKKPVDIGALSDVEQWQREFRELDNALTAWKFSLPSEYGNMARVFNPSSGNKIVNVGWVMLHAAYHTEADVESCYRHRPEYLLFVSYRLSRLAYAQDERTYRQELMVVARTVMRLHSSAAYPTTRSPIFTPSYSASQRCLGAVENVVALCDYVKSNSMLTKLGPPFAFSLWVAARLLLVHGSTIDHQVNPAIHPLVETLREMGVYWQVADRYATLLQRVLDEYYESERAPAGPNGERTTPSTVKILADMRRTAFDLDFLISRQPRQQVAGKLPTVTPARTPAPNDLEYLDVFDFFNMPRLPVSMDGPSTNGTGLGGENLQVSDVGANEFNITNFMVDANSDWFMKAQV